MNRQDAKYSGEESHGFWKRVNSLPSEEKRVMYACGVLLQNMEEDVLRWLVTAEIDAAREKREARKKRKNKATKR